MITRLSVGYTGLPKGRTRHQLQTLQSTGNCVQSKVQSNVRPKLLEIIMKYNSSAGAVNRSATDYKTFLERCLNSDKAYPAIVSIVYKVSKMTNSSWMERSDQ